MCGLCFLLGTIFGGYCAYFHFKRKRLRTHRIAYKSGIRHTLDIL